MTGSNGCHATWSPVPQHSPLIHTQANTYAALTQLTVAMTGSKGCQLTSRTSLRCSRKGLPSTWG